jgi:PAS domain S-box-containing protein
MDQRTSGKDTQSDAAPLEALDLGDLLVRALLDHTPDALIVADEDGRIRLVNNGFEGMFGYDRAEMLGRSVDLLVPEPLRTRHHAHRLHYGASPHRRPMGQGIELEGRRGDGSTFPVEISLSPLERDGRLLTIATVRDITDRTAAERALADTRQRLTLSEDRERIARDLHDKVIQKLFATGLGLQAAASRTDSEPVRDRLRAAIDDLDESIREIRTSIFALHAPVGGHTGLRAEIIEKATDSARILGFSPTVRFVGPVDAATTADEADALLATLQEALSNIVRHAQASSVEIDVNAHDELELVVRDDGVGIPADVAGGDGLRNMRRRASELGGSVRVDAIEPSGTMVRWRVPIGSGRQPR